jgi:hypothetical protein
MSQLVKTKRQANFKDFNRFEAFKGFVEQKNVVFSSFVCKLPHSCQKEPNLHTNSLYIDFIYARIVKNWGNHIVRY